MSAKKGTWTSLMGNDIVVQMIEPDTEGVSGPGAEYGSVVSYNAMGYFLEGEVGTQGMMSSSLKHSRGRQPFEEMLNCRAQIGEGDSLMGLELSLRHANPGSVFRVRMNAKYAYGPSGRKEVQDSRYPVPAVPSMQHLEYEVTVLGVMDIDTFMSRNSADFEDIHLRKECGNRWFYYGDFERAAKAYTKGASKGDAYFQASENGGGAEKQVWDDYISCLNNLSACHMSRGDYYKAKEVCTKVLELEDTNIKALLRAARSSLALLSFEESDVCITRVLELEPDNKIAQQERVKLAKAKKDYKGKKLEMDKKMTENMFGDKEKSKADAKTDAKTKTEKKGDTKATSTPGAQGYGESSNLILLLVTAIAVLIVSVWLATNSKIDVNEPVIPRKFGRKGA